jgi:hypothetical protein
MTMRRHWLEIAAVVALVLPGCSRTGDDVDGSAILEGFRAHGSNPGYGMDAIVSGIVEIDEDTGCVWLSDPDGARSPVVWPLATEVQSDPVGILLQDRQVVRSGDQVEGGGGYVDAETATNGSGLEPFPDSCVQVGQAAVFNADSPINVTHGVGLELEDTLAGRFSPPESIGLEVIAVDPNERSVAVVDFVTGTIHRYRPGQYEAPGDGIDGASGGGGFTHLWANGRIWTYWPLDSAPLAYQPEPLRQVPDSTLQVLPAPDGEHNWLVQHGSDSEPTLIELVNVVEFQLSREMATEIEGPWRPVGATIGGLILTSQDPEPRTNMVSSDGTMETGWEGTALSVGWNGAAIVQPDGSLVVADATLDDLVRVEKPSEGEWVSVGEVASSSSPPVITGADRYLVMLAEESDRDSAGDLVMIDSSGLATSIFELSEGTHVASWSRDGNWVVVVEGLSVTLVSMRDGTRAPLGDLIPESHVVLAAG